LTNDEVCKRLAGQPVLMHSILDNYIFCFRLAIDMETPAAESDHDLFENADHGLWPPVVTTWDMGLEILNINRYSLLLLVPFFMERK